MTSNPHTPGPAMITFSIPGKPLAKGNHKPFIVGGHARMVEGNPKARAWANTVSAVAAEAWGARELLTEPCGVEVCFYFARPKSHYRTGRNSDQLKPGAPRWHGNRPDGDKLMRNFGDALTGVIVRDDSLFARVTIEKCWGSRDQTLVKIYEIEATNYPERNHD